MKERLVAVETRLTIVENEVELNRTFKHATNGTLHTQNGKMEVIVNQQNHTAEAIEKLTVVVESALDKIGKIINLKFMLVGGASVGSVIAVCAYYMFKMYLDYHK